MDENVRAFAQMHEARRVTIRAGRTRIVLIVVTVLFVTAVALAVGMVLTVDPYP